MEVKEAIEFLDKVKKERIDLKLNRHYLNLSYRFDGISYCISFLQELEKYREIWEEFKKIYDNTPIRLGHYPNGIAKPSTSVGELMEKLEQKYFPQPVKKVITIEVEMKSDIEMGWFKNYIKAHLDKVLDKYDVKVNIKEAGND